MSFGVSVKFSGPLACFSRPEMKVERVSYDAMTPSAARGAIEAIYWKPSIRWVIDRICVLQPIRFTNLRRNELGSRLSYRNLAGAARGESAPPQLFIEEERQQRASLLLRDVAYLVEAHFEIVGPDDSQPGKHLDMFQRRVRAGQCMHQPYLGCREFPARFEPLNGQETSLLRGERELGYMLLDLDFEQDYQARFFKAKLVDGWMAVPKPGEEGVFT